MDKIKLFVPLGTQKFPFGRIITALNQLVDRGKYKADEIVIQSALYPVEPKFTHFGLIPHEDFDRYMQEADVVVTHSGVNSIISCMEMGKPLVVCPRLHEFNEHVDNHQMEIATLMHDKYDVLIINKARGFIIRDGNNKPFALPDIHSLFNVSRWNCIGW